MGVNMTNARLATAILTGFTIFLHGGPLSPPDALADGLEIFPPWSHGRNNPSEDKGIDVTVPDVDNLPDLHGNLSHPRLVLYVGGNYFFAMAPLVKAFEKKYPRIRGGLFYETLPPGLLAKQIEKKGRLTIGNATITIPGDVYAAGLKKVRILLGKKLLVGKPVAYATNDLTIMVPKGNPAGIKGLADLGKPGVRLVMPNPAWEGVARQIKGALYKAGGKKLVQAVYVDKVKNGETVLTRIHHRQSPMSLMRKNADAGVTWRSEAIFQEQEGHPIENVSIPDSQNVRAIYAAGLIRGSRHKAWAKRWLSFLGSPEALHIFERYGFKPVTRNDSK